MMYPNVHAASDALGRKLYSFAGHSVDTRHTSYCFDQLARAVGFIAKNRPINGCCGVSFEAEIYVDGKTIPVFVTINGEEIFSEVELLIRREMP